MEEEQSSDSEDDTGGEGDGFSSRGSDQSSSTPTPLTPAAMTIPKVKFTWESMMNAMNAAEEASIQDPIDDENSVEDDLKDFQLSWFDLTLDGLKKIEVVVKQFLPLAES